MKQFLKIFLAVILAMMLGGFLLLMTVIGIVGVVSGSMSATPTYVPQENTILKIDLKGRQREYVQTDPLAFLFGEKRQEQSLHKQLQAISAAKENPNIAGIYLDAKDWRAGTASAQALRRALTDFKESGKFVVAYGDQYWQSTYYLCSVADKVIVNPHGSIDLHGLSATYGFFAGLLEKLGVGVQVFKVGTYKSAVEPFIRKDMSPENREQTLLFLNEQWNAILSDISESRRIDQDELNKSVDKILMFDDAESYIEGRLADMLCYRSEAESYLKMLAGMAEKDNLVFASVDELCTMPQPATKITDQIAVLYAEGEITDASESLYDSEPYITASLLKEIQSLKKDENVKAVVLRINSPGGSAYLSEQIWKELSELKTRKPLIVSMGDVAASGGYYIAACADRIVANPATLTGSIGVFGIIPDFSGLIKKTGVTFDNVKTNPYADFHSTIEPLDETEKRALQAYVEKTYRLFMQRCADGRDMGMDSVARIAEGRVWSGVSAERIGLVDELGDLDTAISIAADHAQISEYVTVNYPLQKDLFTLLLETSPMQIKALFSPFSDPLFEELRQINKLKNIAPVQTRLPFDFNTTL